MDEERTYDEQGTGEDEARVLPLSPAEAVAEGFPEHMSSVRDRLRKQRSEVQKRDTCDIDLPGYSGELVARYKMMGAQELEVIGKKIQRQMKTQADRLLYGSMDTLIAACEGFFLRIDGQDGDVLHPLTVENEPVKYDENLAKFLEFPATSAREVLRGVFADNEMAIVQHAAKHSRWMADPTSDPNSPLNFMEA